MSFLGCKRLCVCCNQLFRIFIGLVPHYLNIFENIVFIWEGIPNMSQQHASSPVNYTLVCTWVAIFIPLQLFWRVLFYPSCA